MAMTLPSEILFMVLDNLGEERDYNSLFQCALASKLFTEHALSVLYRIYDASPLRGGGTEDEQFKRKPVFASAASKGDRSSTLRKWITLWRSILLSTLEVTYLPYYSYIRYLDLDDLGNLLGSGPTVKDELITQELLEFVSNEYISEGNKRRRSARTLPDNDWIKVKLGSAIVQRNSLIRGMSCDVPPATLNQWIESSPQLQTLSVWSGSVFSQHAGEKIRVHCPDFKQLRIYIWQNKAPGNSERDAETDAEELFNTLRPNSLEYFEVLSFSHLGPRSIKALGTQKDSLMELKLTSLDINTIRELPSLTALPRLEVLTLTDSAPTAWDEQFHTTVGEISEWLQSCTKLKRLELRKFLDDTELLTKVLTTSDIHLTTLSFSGCKLSATRGFLDVLASHTSLQTLYLRGEGSENPNDNANLVQALTSLSDLRDLELKDVSDFFTMDNVLTLTPFLPQLERLWISGEAYNDSLWDAFLCCPNLKSLAIYALSNFTAAGVIEFISRLGPANKGMNLSILNAVCAASFPYETQVLIREFLEEGFKGSFDFGLAQEEFSDASSDIELSD
ncbi:hypothetical protein BJX61DRAFT_537211 [Aspergillus egyptiacus]|nr:hypothetical protein BJX61DRAFT_537211 [Aspergillus egyptiacus]